MGPKAKRQTGLNISHRDFIDMAEQLDIGISKESVIPQQTTQVVVDTHSTMTEEQELQSLRQIIVTWREIEKEVSSLSEQMREKKKRQKALEEMILRIMKKFNIGALDLKGSGGRLLYRRQTTKVGLNPKTLAGLLTEHMKSETAAADAMKFINENRTAKVRESLLYEKE